jgi:hypothetical protein
MPLSREVLAVLHGEPRRMGHTRLLRSFETPRESAAPQDDGWFGGLRSIRGTKATSHIPDCRARGLFLTLQGASE